MVKLLAFTALLCNVGAICGAFSSLQTHRHARSSDQCKRFTGGPFDYCSAAGYNDTFEFPEGLTGDKLRVAALGFNELVQRLTKCSQNTSTAPIAMACSYFLPQCSNGKRVYPCKRVCNEFLKLCEKGIPDFLFDYIVASCHILPNEKASSGKCHEPPNFTTNDSVPGPLDRGCQELIIPACKNLGVFNHTLISLEQQKRLYKVAYKKEYKADNVETDDPPLFKELLQKFPKCKINIKKLFCGEYFPPCFLNESENPGYYTICQSLCDQINRDCPTFFSDHFEDAEYCSLAANEKTSHGFCRRKGWPPPFAWARYIHVQKPTKVSPTKSPKSTGPKVWVIVVAVLVPLIVVALVLSGLIWWKWRHVPSSSGYTKQEDDTVPFEGAMET